MTPEEIIKRFYNQRDQRWVIQDQWDSIERYIAPYRGRFFKDERSENSIQWRRPFVFDGTAIMASQALAASLHSSLTSPSMQWFKFKFKNQVLNDDVEALAWLQECGRLVFDALQSSNFNIEVNETYQDLVNYGTSVLLETEATDSDGADFTFQALPIKHCYFETDVQGKLLNFYRQYQWTAIQLVDYFGMENLPKEIVEHFEDAVRDQNRKWDVIYCVYREFDNEIDVDAKNLSVEMRPFQSKYVLLDTGEMIGELGGFYEMPAFVPRWRKTTDSMWGNSPAMIALADTLTLNRTIELNLAAVEKALDPPTITTSRGVIGDLDLSAGALTMVRDIGEIQPFESRARFDVTYQELDRLRQNIEKYFFIPQLLLPPMEGTPATATEISVRVQQLERLIGPTLGRLQTDLLEPIVIRTFRMLFRNDQLPDMPDSVAENDSAAEIEYTSPLARTQEASKVQAIERWLAGVGQMAGITQEVLDLPNFDAAIKELARLMGVDADLINSDAKRDELRADREAMMAQQQQMEMMQAQGGAGGQPGIQG